MASASIASTTCIYCNQTGPFSDEHIFPGGLGGDNEFQLRGLVCLICNRDRFGPLEEELMRRSPVAFARQFRMLQGRQQGKSSKPPTLDTSITEMLDPHSHLMVEIEFLPGGHPDVRPQLLFHLDDRPIQGSSQADLEAFRSALASIVTDTVQTIGKLRDDAGTTFEVTTYQWDGAHYLAAKTCSEPRAPKLGIWIERLSMPSNAKPESIYASRLFQRRKGQLVLRALPQNAVGMLLDETRQALSQWAPSTPFVSKPIVNPSANFAVSMDMHQVGRAIAKIGVNHACHEYGQSVMRLPMFDSIKASILTGEPAIAPERWDDPNVEALFTRDNRDIHLAMLWPLPQADGTFDLLFGVRFFGNAFQNLMLARNVSLPADSAPVIYTVHFKEYRMERHNWIDYLRLAITPRFLEERR